MPITPYGAIQMRNNTMSFIGSYSLQNGNDMSSSQFQSAVSSTTSCNWKLPDGDPHHPITCTDKIYFDEHGTFACEHGEVPPDDERTKACLNHSLALLLIE